ncbi:MAG: hypothetical protein MZV65_00460 [Chromatiales bacterium]|nr:hypothetical protein [Chromatiales bacterium]
MIAAVIESDAAGARPGLGAGSSPRRYLRVGEQSAARPKSQAMLPGLAVRAVRLSRLRRRGRGAGRRQGVRHALPAGRSGAGRRRWRRSWASTVDLSGIAAAVRLCSPASTKRSASAAPTAARSAPPTPSSARARQIHGVIRGCLHRLRPVRAGLPDRVPCALRRRCP